MKQYRFILALFIILSIGWTLLITDTCAQQLKQIQKGTDFNQIPATNGNQYTQVYRDAIPYILDTLGIRDSLISEFPLCIDSIFILGDSLYTVIGGDTTTVGYMYQGAVYFLGTPYDVKKGDFYKATNIFNPSATKNQIWDGSSWVDFDKDIYLDNELTTYHTGAIPILPKKGDLWYNPNVSPAQLQIHTGSGWVNVSYYDADLVPYMESSAANKTELYLAPTNGLTFELKNETDGIIKLQYTDLGGGVSNKQRWSIDTLQLNNIVTRDTALISQIVSDSLTTINQDQIVSITGGGITNVTGTYPNFTVTSTEVDGSVTNEIQDLSLTGNTLSLTGDGTTVNLSGYLDNVTTNLTVSGTSSPLTLNSSDGTDVTITAGSGISLAGTSGNITINATNAGTVTGVTASSPLISSGGATPNITADTTSGTGLGTNYKLTLKQDKLTGANKRIPYFTVTNTLSNSDNLVFDNSAKALGIGTASPIATLDLSANSINSIRLHDAGSGTNMKTWAITAGSGQGERMLNFASRNDAGSDYNFMQWQRVSNSHVMANLFIPHLATSSGTEVLTTNTGGEIYKSALKTVNSNSLLGSGNLSTVTSITASSPLTGGTITSTGTIGIQTASGSQSGALSSTDWTTFNGKIGSLNGLTASSQTFVKATNVNDFDITSTSSTHTFSLPYQSNTTSMRLGPSSKLLSNCVALGVGVLSSATAGNNTAVGFDILRSAGTGGGGTNNLGFGFQPLYSLTTGINNVAIGSYALYYGTSISNSIGIGESSLLNCISGSNNVAIGRSAGRSTTGSGNVFIGTEAGYSETGSNKLYIANNSTSTPLISGDFSSSSAKINGSLAVTTLSGTATALLGNDASGKLVNLGLSGLTISGGNLVASGITGTGSTNYLSYWNGTTSQAATNISFNASSGIGFGIASGSITHAIDMASGTSIRLRGAGIVDKYDSGGANGYVLQATGGFGVQWVSTAGLFTEVDGSVTNEGYLGVRSGGSNDAILQGYNSAGTATGNGTYLNGGDGIAITETTSTNGGTITATALSSQVCQASNYTSNISTSTAGTYTINLVAQDVLTSGYTLDLTNDYIQVSNTGLYEVIFSGQGNGTNEPLIYFEKWNGSSWDYFYGYWQGVFPSSFSNIHFSDIINLSANNRVRLRYVLTSGNSLTLSNYRLTLKRIN